MLELKSKSENGFAKEGRAHKDLELRGQEGKKILKMENKKNPVFTGSSSFRSNLVLIGFDRVLTNRAFKIARTGDLAGSRFNRSDGPIRSEFKNMGLNQSFN